jgi:hypothetical protein
MDAYKKLLQELLDAGVRFLVVGGYAAIAHGLTRATDDLDLWIEPTRENAEKTLQALQRHGIPIAGLSVEILSDPDSFFRVGDDAGRKVDIMANAGGDLLFGKAWIDRFETAFFGLDVPFLGLRDLLSVKRAIGRHKDLADVESLRAFHRLEEEDDSPA